MGQAGRICFFIESSAISILALWFLWIESRGCSNFYKALMAAHVPACLVLQVQMLNFNQANP